MRTILVWLPVAVAGCTAFEVRELDAGQAIDAATDGGDDAGPIDAGVQLDSGAPEDAGRDAGLDDAGPLPDGGMDAGMDAGTDGGTDAGPLCGPLQGECGGVCRDLLSDSSNCGSCERACGGAEVCAAGQCATPRVLAVYPSTAVEGQHVRLHGVFSASTATVLFPGVATPTSISVSGDGVADAIVPANVSAGLLRLSVGAPGPRFRRASFGLGVGQFRRAYEQGEVGRSWPRLATARSGAATFAGLTWLYVMGGSSATDAPLATVERAMIHADGTIDELASTSMLTTERAAPAAARGGDRVYVLGGAGFAGDLTSIDVADLMSDGSLGAFTRSDSSLSVARSGCSALVIGNWLYVVGGTSTSIERAPIRIDGSLGAFSIVPGVSTTRARRRAAAIVVGGRLYLFGGADASALTTFESAPVDGDGNIGAFIAAGSLRSGRDGARAIHLGADDERFQTVFLIGGSTTNSRLEVVTINAASGAGVSADADSSLQVARSSAMAEVISNHLYVLGGTGAAGTAGTVERATINDSGSLGMSPTTLATVAVPGALPGAGRAFTIGRRLYFYQEGGGFASAQIAEDGSLGPFSVEGFSSNGTAAIAVAGGRVWVLGGGCVDTSFARFAYDTSGRVSPTAMLGSMAFPLRQGAAAAIGTDVFLFGGQSSGCSTTSMFQRSPIGAPAWSAAGASMLASSASKVLLVDDDVYLVGGVGASGADRRIEQARWSSGSIGSWSTRANALDVGRQGHGLVVIGDYVYLFGGYEPEANSASRAALPLTGSFTSFRRDVFETSRGYGAYVVIDNALYVMAGHDYDGPDTALTSVERLELD
jgi:N-acetylneuraminic acid mutarotase